MDRFIGKAEALEIFAQKNEEAPETQPVICEKCGNDMSVDKRTGGCVSNYCPWCGTRKKQAGAQYVVNNILLKENLYEIRERAQKGISGNDR